MQGWKLIACGRLHLVRPPNGLPLVNGSLVGHGPAEQSYQGLDRLGLAGNCLDSAVVKNSDRKYNQKEKLETL